MDYLKYEEAQRFYEAGDYRAAAKGFLTAADRGSAGNGSTYHMAGNALMRLGRHSDALTVYRHALSDEIYDRRGAVQSNLGSAYRALGELGKALLAYKKALEEDDYATPYKAWLGVAAIQMERGKIEEAAAAYRKAALDESNPEPSRALVNLGLCFMGLERPKDAVDAYQAALGFDDYMGRGKALANLGQAYTALGDHAAAVKVFEKAVDLHEHTLSGTAAQAYEASKAALPPAPPAPEIVEGWVTGEMPPALGEGFFERDTEEPPAFASTGFMGQPSRPYAASAGQADASYPTASHSARADAAAATLGFGDEAAVSDFFTRSEDEMRVIERESRREKRRSKKRSSTGAVIAAVVVCFVLLGGLFGAGYFFGFGWPMQSSTVNGVFEAYKNGEDVGKYWVAVPGADVEREMAKVPAVSSYTIDEIVRGSMVSEARVTVTPEKGVPLEFTVTLSREGVGWRVTGIDNKWSSKGGG
ncbi:MAG: tetratricopeptide repeat protein [Coriobacteriia bacterium]|nr:tetratricopeptide repeat protein [Coriobacteriia bacterium]